MEPFDKCPRCGLLSSWRVTCSCGYMASHAQPATTEPATKPSTIMRVIAVLLVAPVAVCAIAVLQWSKGNEFLGVLGGIVPSIIVGAVGFGLLGLANYLWTGKTRDERGQ